MNFFWKELEKSCTYLEGVNFPYGICFENPCLTEVHHNSNRLKSKKTLIHLGSLLFMLRFIGIFTFVYD